MDYTDILPIIQQFVNVKAVLLSIILTQGAKYTQKRILMAKGITAEMESGTLFNRLLPFLPVLIGILFCTLVEKFTNTLMENTIRGIFTGAMGAYGYRTAKVSFFGE